MPTFLYLTAHYNAKQVRLFRSFYIAYKNSSGLSRSVRTRWSKYTTYTTLTLANMRINRFPMAHYSLLSKTNKRTGKFWPAFCNASMDREHLEPGMCNFKIENVETCKILRPNNFESKWNNSMWARERKVNKYLWRAEHFLKSLLVDPVERFGWGLAHHWAGVFLIKMVLFKSSKGAF